MDRDPKNPRIPPITVNNLAIIACSQNRNSCAFCRKRHAGDGCFLDYAEEMKDVARLRPFATFSSARRSAGATERRSAVRTQTDASFAATSGAALLAAQAGDETPDRDGEVACRSGCQVFARSEKGYEHSPCEPAPVMLAHEVKLVAVTEIDSGNRTLGALADGARRAAADMRDDGIVGVADAARRLGGRSTSSGSGAGETGAKCRRRSPRP